MPIPIQNFGTARPNPDGDELIPVVLPDGNGGYTDHRITANAIAALADTGDTVAVVAPNPRGDYDNSATYTQLDTVRYDDGGGLGTYLHHDDSSSTGILPTDQSKWVLFARDGVDGSGVQLQDNGSSVPQRGNTNFVNATFTDDAANDRTTIDVGAPGGTGDMLKSTYDTDDDGVVDAADVAVEATSIAGAPGNGRYYGTDGSGTKGFYTFPAGTGDMVKATYDTDDDGVVDAADVAAIANALAGTPEAGKYWGTPPGDTTQGFQDLPSNGITFVRQETTPTGNTDVIWIKPSTAQWFYYDPFSATWIEK